MNRTDRLYALVEELRRAGQTGRRADQLAERFEVNGRTVKRDISALQQAGLPIYGTPGPRGGYRLVRDDALLRPVTFTAGEAAAIAAALSTQPHLPFATDGTTALTKITQAMTPTVRQAAEELTGRVWTTTSSSRSRAARSLDIAMKERRVVAITYTDRDDRTTRRRVDPLQFVQTHGHWYLLAFCRTAQSGRWFRLDRIRRADVTRQQADNYDIETVIGEPPPEARPVSV
jgi:predicted DNA-binding transcriptional regulator YafY